MTTIITIYAFLLICLGLSIWKSRAKTIQAFRMGARALWNMAPSLLAIVGLVGLILGTLPPETISRLLGVEAGAGATIAAAIIGSITLIPALVSFPLAGSLLHKGARTSNIVIFLGAWAAIKVPQLIAETQFLGPSYTTLRFILTLFAVIVIGRIMEKIITINDLPNIE